MGHEKLQIKCKKQIFVEGADAKYFFIWALEEYKIEDVQVVDFGGIRDLTNFLRTWKKLENFHMIESMLIVRDAEQSADDAMKSICGGLSCNHLPAPQQAYSFSDGKTETGQKIRIGIALLPNRLASTGTLEDLCLNMVEDAQYLDVVNDFLARAANLEKLAHEHKSRVHAYLSVKNKYVGMKIGEAAKAGAWNWGCEDMKEIRSMIEAL